MLVELALLLRRGTPTADLVAAQQEAFAPVRPRWRASSRPRRRSAAFSPPGGWERARRHAITDIEATS
jgi:hypothetical protein